MRDAEIRERMVALAKAQIDLKERYGDEELPADVFEAALARKAELEDLKKTWDTRQQLTTGVASAGDLYRALTAPAAAPIHAGAGAAGSPERVAERGTLADRILGSAEWQSWVKSAAPHGTFSEGIRLTSPVFQFKTLVTGASDTSGGALVTNDVRPGIVVPGRQPLVLRSVITNATTGSDTIEYVRETGQTNAAAPVAEATATAGASGTKPESAVALEKVTALVRTIAHWIPVTRRALADAGQLRAYLDEFLRRGVEEALEDQIINGDGTGEELVGIANTPGVQTQAFATDVLTTTRQARTKVRTVGRARPNAYLLNPADWETIQLTKDGNDSFYFGGPANAQQETLWGLPVVESEGVTAGTGYVGDFRQVVLWDREQANVQSTDSHADFFIRNIIALLGEGRYALGVLRPVALVEMDLTAL